MEIPKFAEFKSEQELETMKMEDLAMDLFHLNDYANEIETTLKTQRGEKNREYLKGLLHYINKIYKIKYKMYVKLSDAELFRNDDYQEYKCSIEKQASEQSCDTFWAM